MERDHHERSAVGHIGMEASIISGAPAARGLQAASSSAQNSACLNEGDIWAEPPNATDFNVEAAWNTSKSVMTLAFISRLTMRTPAITPFRQRIFVTTPANAPAVYHGPRVFHTNGSWKDMRVERNEPCVLALIGDAGWFRSELDALGNRRKSTASNRALVRPVKTAAGFAQSEISQ